MSNPLDFTPAYSVEAEMSTLGSMLIESDVIDAVTALVTEADFSRETHQRVFRCILALHKQGQAVDLVTVSQRLKDTGEIDAVGLPYLLSLFDTVPTAANAAYYAGIVRDKAIHRRLQVAGVDLLALTKQEDVPGPELVEQAEQMVFSLTQGGEGTQGYTSGAGAALLALSDKIEQQAMNPAAMLGLSTGFDSIDAMTSGLQAPNFIVIGARPGVGKSALMTKIAAHVARQGSPVFIASMEMSQEEVMVRMLCTEARLDSHRLRRGHLSPEEWQQCNEAQQWLYEMPLAINDRSGVTPSYLRSELRRFVRSQQQPLGLICVDYIQLMRSDRPSQNRLAELTDVSIELKAIAREFNAPLIALSQLSRASLSRQNKRPDLPDLRETGQIEQDADIVAFIYRADMIETDSGDGPVSSAPAGSLLPAELIIRKHRGGRRGTVMLDFLPEYTLFMDQPQYNGGF